MTLRSAREALKSSPAYGCTNRRDSTIWKTSPRRQWATPLSKTPLRVILNGLGKDAAMIISRINGFTYVETDYDFKTGELTVVREKAFSDGERAAVK